MTTVPAQPKLYHIVHVDRLPSIVAKGLLPDVVMQSRRATGTTIGMANIKERRLTLPIQCRPGLHVGDCVPFYFCPRSIMLYVIHRANHAELAYRGGQGPIVHLEADLHATVDWAEHHHARWAFTLSNAGASYFEDRCDLGHLSELDWKAIAATRWTQTRIKEGKQAEFLVEGTVPWTLIERVGVRSAAIGTQIDGVVAGAAHRPRVEVLPAWYY